MYYSFSKLFFALFLITFLSSCFTCKLYDSKISYGPGGDASLSGCIECKGNVNDIKNITRFKVIK